MKQTGPQLPSIDEQNPLHHQQKQQINIPVASNAAKSAPTPPPNPPQSRPKTTRRLTPNLPCRDLLTGPRENYLKIGVPLYEASIRCDWVAAKAILDKNKEIDLVRYSITENGETALHVAASAKGPKHVEEFVKNLVGLMKKEHLALENENFNTALYLAAVAGNVETVKIMVKENRTLLVIPGAGGQMMPLYAAALFGNYDVVKYLYENSQELRDDGWTDQNRGWLLEKCVDNDMFDIALEIVKKYPKLGSGSGNVLGVLARKPEAFREAKSNIIGKTMKLSKYLYSLMFITHQPYDNKHPEASNGIAPKDLTSKPEKSPETKSNIIGRTIKLVFEFIGSKVGVHEKENKALPLLRIIWEDIAKKPKAEIDKILRGPPDSIKQEKSASGRVVRAIQLQKLIYEHLDKMEVETEKIFKAQPDSNTQDTNPPPAKVDHALQLKNLISEYLVNLHIASEQIVGKDNTPVVGRRDQALQLQKLISEHIVHMHGETQNIIKGKEDQTQSLKKLISRNITKMRSETALKDSHSSRVLFVAAEMGNTKFLVELIRQYPDLIWKVNDNNQSIFHIAVKHRHEGIYNLLYEIGAMKDLITPLRDENDNNMLHLVGTRAKQKQLEDVSGVALQMQRELLWFQEVNNMIPLSYKERKNVDGLTPHELFTMEHKELVTQGEKWMKGTANQCMVVAALIATIVFAAAFTVPGGYDQSPGKQNGIPVFHSKATFIVFVVADAISLFASSASILIFLSILTSRYAERDFLESLPKKLISGLVALFLSITTMTVAFDGSASTVTTSATATTTAAGTTSTAATSTTTTTTTITTTATSPTTTTSAISAATTQQQQRDPPSLQQPNMTLVKGTSREEYLKIGVPLYEASIKCNWKAAKAILDKRPDLVGFSITEHGDTPLHVAASAKGDLKRVKEFVKNLVDMMTQTQLRLINKNHNTALYLAAVAGNVETVGIMVKEDRGLLKIPGANYKKMMPLYGAALFGNTDVVKYITRNRRF
ncbi:hypothetical protein SSX86_019258 [Deinandra increscens subsp. villosa]|uniref:PGG domain-containing protein n=1 Tax=Deinandra increscens subsp. villosa TaxID=3103831 RepID=A0AAP0CWT1_9ASTR